MYETYKSEGITLLPHGIERDSMGHKEADSARQQNLDYVADELFSCCDVSVIALYRAF
ncbi:MAG: hypothetical protein QW290_04430 [Sulfolobales archaeon]